MLKHRKIGLAAGFLLLLSSAIGFTIMLSLTLPVEDGTITLPGLKAAGRIDSDAFGIPAIKASNRNDALLMLGYLHARDRLFQMELMRRQAAGRLAEIFGKSAVDTDKQQRSLQLSRTAKRIVQNLPDAQKHNLAAYTEGINVYLKQTRLFAPEFLLLQHKPEPWRVEDSILVILGMFQNLNGQEQDERMLSVMHAALPQALVTFLTPDTDIYSSALVGGSEPRRFIGDVSAAWFTDLPDSANRLAAIDANPVIAGSNNWVVAGSKTRDGRAIVANDMHLGLRVPNIWYRASLNYAQRTIYGVTLPGVPGVIVGANNDIAWGFTNVTGDFLDLIRLQMNPDDANQYKTADGWKNFEQHVEHIQVKDEKSVTLHLQSSIWGPVSITPLLGQKVAVKWIALQQGAVNLRLLDMDSAENTQQAMHVLNNTGAPAQNAVIADRHGDIAWTYMGRFPKRFGFDGLISRSWADATLGWDGFIAAEQLPRLSNPKVGFIVTANNRTLGRDYPYIIGHNWGLSYRAARISELLQAGAHLTEDDLLAMQLDTRSAVFDFYQQLALHNLQKVSNPDKQLRQIKSTLNAWDGHMQQNSIGAGFLLEFRKQLAEEVFSNIVAACRQYDAEFQYSWREMETPLRLLLQQQPHGLLRQQYADNWHGMILQSLRNTADTLQAQFPQTPLPELSWGQMLPITIQHPFSKLSPVLALLLDMPTFAGDGCASFCVKVMNKNHSASERLVISPQYPESAIFHMPGGQSGHPFSRHYADQQPYWQKGLALPFLPESNTHQLHVLPES